jgi:hypothetical protein
MTNVLATRSGQPPPLRPPKNTPKGRIFEPWYLHHNAMQLYEILCVSETNSVAILLYITRGLCEDQVSLCGELSLVQIGSISRLGSRP